MRSEGYLRSQRNAIRHEWIVILKEHLGVSIVLLLFILFFVFLSVQFEHPDKWDEVTITLSNIETVRLVRGGTRLDVYDEHGCRYTINRNEESIKQQLKVGFRYTFVYSDNYYHNIIEDIQIDNVEYIKFDDSVKDYYNFKILLGAFVVAFIVLLIYLNFTIFKANTEKRFKRIEKYKQRMRDGN